MKLFLYLFCFACLCSSCDINNYTYIQTPLNIPNLKKRGDLKVDASISPKGGSLQTSYAMTNHVGVMANYNKAFRGKADALDLGVGSFAATEKMFYSVYAGAGFGDLNINLRDEDYGFMSDDYYLYKHSATYKKFFIQPSIGREFRNKRQVNLALRITYVYYHSYHYNLEEMDGRSRSNVRRIALHTLETTSPVSSWIMEPCLGYEFASNRRFTVLGQVSYTLVDSFGGRVNGSRPHPYYMPLTINFSLRLNLNTNKEK